jgi:uncharacterized membrane protein YgdD (TMEM256/DUF423 family)
MSALARCFLLLGGVNAALVVLLGAFAAHGLKARISSDMMAVYQTATLYHAIHALGLILIGVVARWLPRSGYLRSAGWTMFAGIVLFCGSLYLVSAAGAGWLVAITPVGGAGFIFAWVLFCVAVLKAPG